MISENFDDNEINEYIKSLKDEYNNPNGRKMIRPAYIRNKFYNIRDYCDKQIYDSLNYDISTPGEFKLKHYYYIVFAFLKIFDSASKYLEKNNSLDKDLFYNNSEWNIEDLINEYDKNNDLLLNNIKCYIKGFNNSVQKVFDVFMFDKFLELLKDNNKLLDFIIGIYVIDLEEYLFRNMYSIQSFYNSIINEIKYYYIQMPYEVMYWGYSFYNNFTEEIILSLFEEDYITEEDIKKKNKITLFDPICCDGELLSGLYFYIKSINPNCKIELYGCENNRMAYFLCLSRMLLMNQDMNNFIFLEKYACPRDDIFGGASALFALGEKLTYDIDLFYNKVFDYVISDFGYSLYRKPFTSMDFGYSLNSKSLEIKDLKEVLPYLIQKFNKKLIFTLPYDNLVGFHDLIKECVNLNILESIIRLPISSESKRDTILILNQDKNNDEFILIDESNKADENFNINSKISDISFLDNYFMFKEGKTSRIINNEDVGEFFNFYHLMYSSDVIFEDKDIDYMYLGELAEFTDISQEEKCDLLIANPLNSDKVLYYKEEAYVPSDSYYFEIDENGSRKKIYYKDNIVGSRFNIFLNIKSNKITKDFLYFYLNSNKGKNFIFEYSSNDMIDISELYYIPIPLPSLNEQKNIVETSRKMQKFFTEMDIWKNNYLNDILNYKRALEVYNGLSCTIDSDNFRKDFCKPWKIVYQGLLLPLSSAFLISTKGSDDEALTRKNYLRLFEFLATFNVIVLLSYVKNSTDSPERYIQLLSKIWILKGIGKDKEGNKIFNKKTWHRMSFGSWTTIYSRLPNIFKKNNFINKFDEKLFDELSQRKYFELFNNLRANYRNKESHEGLEDGIDVSKKLDELQAFVDTDIYNILKLYSGFKLYYTIGVTESDPNKKNLYKNKAESLNGPCNPPFPIDLIEKEILDSYSLYLYDPINRSYLKLDNDLIKCRRIPDDNANRYGIYFYDSVKISKKGIPQYIQYKCYEYNDYWKIEWDELIDEDSVHKISDEFIEIVLNINRDNIENS